MITKMPIKFLFLFVLIHNTYSVRKHDIELESLIRFDKSFISKWTNNMHKYKALRSKQFDELSEEHKELSKKLRNPDSSDETKNVENPAEEQMVFRTSKETNDEKNITEQGAGNSTKETRFSGSVEDNFNKKSKSNNTNANSTRYYIHKLLKERHVESTEYTGGDKDDNNKNKQLNNRLNENNTQNNSKIRYYNISNSKQNENVLNTKPNSIESNGEKVKEDEIHNRSKRELLFFNQNRKETRDNQVIPGIDDNKISEEVQLGMDIVGSPKKYDKHTETYLANLVENGVQLIKEIRKILQVKLPSVSKELTSDDSFPLKKGIESYSKKVNNYIALMLEREVYSDIDREHSLLDIIASSRMLLHSEISNLFHIFNMNAKNATQDEKAIADEEINKHTLNYKKQEIINICKYINICRTFPGISDYFAELIDDLLVLPDKILALVVEGMKKLITKRTHFFKSFMKEDIADMIGSKLHSISLDLQNFKETLYYTRSIITQRFKLMKTDDYILKIRAKAVRLLIDILDKTFGLAAGEELTVMTFDTVAFALNDVAENTRPNADVPLSLFMEHLVSVIRHHWNEDVRNEVAVLTEVMMTGRTEHKNYYQRLFSLGSALVKADVLYSDSQFY